MTKIKDLPSIDRPREKLLKYGTDKLSDFEFLAILRGNAVKNSKELNITLANSDLRHIL